MGLDVGPPPHDFALGPEPVERACRRAVLRLSLCVALRDKLATYKHPLEQRLARLSGPTL